MASLGPGLGRDDVSLGGAPQRAQASPPGALGP